MNIEIGTSDFRTGAGILEGVYIEPVKYYFDRLPDCNKENVAISNKEGEIKVYYLTDKEITKYNLPQWTRGCNSIGSPHPTVKRVLEELKIPLSVVSCDTVKVVRIKSIIDKYKIEQIDLLKIDTEGHDTVILNDYLDTVDIKPKVIIFENNELSNKPEVIKVIDRLNDLGYNCKQIKNDIVAT